MDLTLSQIREASKLFGADSSQHIEFIALEVGEIMHNFVDIHNHLFRFSLRRVIPIPGFFQTPQYDEFLQIVDMLRGHLTNLENELPKDSTKVPEMLSATRDYVRSVQHSLSTFNHMCSKLSQKAKGTKKYSKEEYQLDRSAYLEAEGKRTRHGKMMNAIFKTGSR